MAKNQIDNNNVFADELFDDTDHFEKIQLGQDNLETAPIDDNLNDILDGFAAESDEDEDWLLKNAKNSKSETLDLETTVIPDASFVGQPDQGMFTDETMVVDPLKMRSVTENTDEPEFEDAYIATAPIEAPRQQTGLFSTQELPDDQDVYATAPIDTVYGEQDDHDIYLDDEDEKKHRKIFWIFIGTLIAVCTIAISVLGYNAYSKIRKEEALKSTTTTTDTTDSTSSTSTTTVKPTQRDEYTSDYTSTSTDSSTSDTYDTDSSDSDDYDEEDTKSTDDDSSVTDTNTQNTTDHTENDSSDTEDDESDDHEGNTGTTNGTAGTEP